MITSTARRRDLSSETDPWARGETSVEEAELRIYLLSRLDAHLAELHTLRHELAHPRPGSAESRWTTAVATAVAARRYAEDVAIAIQASVPR